MRRAVRAIIQRDDSLLVMKRNKFGKEYYALVGGGIDLDETPEQALVREVKEESGLDVISQRLVYIEEAGEMYGTQYVFVCEVNGGEPALSLDSEEAKIHALGQNLYEPMWLKRSELATTELLPYELRDHLVADLANGFPEQPITFTATE